MDENERYPPYVFLGHVETTIYVVLGVFLGATAILAIVGCLHLFVSEIRDLGGTSAIFVLIDRLLLVLMLVELLHTVRISIKSHSLFVEPFLVIGLIAIIRRTLVLTLQAEDFTRNTAWSSDIQSHFHAATIEGAMLALLISVLVASIYVIRKTKAVEPI
ncbi:MAG: phosphate-starvation-inducible PsiE family protein [Acidobacteriaceae bacterium]|jgi:uncharacterized membrane protein (DUF373 family)